MSPPLAIAGNIAHVRTRHPHRPPRTFLGGAAWHIAAAAARAGLTAAPVSLIGDDLTAALHEHAAAAGITLAEVRTAPGPSARFDLHYDEQDQIAGVDSDYGVADGLTSHVLATAPRYQRWHVCCRRPLDPLPVLRLLQHLGATVSVDFFLTSAADMITSTAPLLPATSAVFVNTAELAFLAGTVPLRELPLVVATDGPRQATAYRSGAVTATATPPPIAVADATGAGDTLIGCFLAHSLAADTDALYYATQAASAHIAARGQDPGSEE